MKKVLLQQVLYELLLVLIIIFIVYIQFIIETGYGLDLPYNYSKFMAPDVFGLFIHADKLLIILFGFLLIKYAALFQCNTSYALTLMFFHLISGILIGLVTVLISKRIIYLEAVLFWDKYGCYPSYILFSANLASSYKCLKIWKGSRPS